MGGTSSKNTASIGTKPFSGVIYWTLPDSKRYFLEHVRSNDDSRFMSDVVFLGEKIKAWINALENILEKEGTIQIIEGNFSYEKAHTDEKFRKRQLEGIRVLLEHYITLEGKFSDNVEVLLESVEDTGKADAWIESVKAIISDVFRNVKSPPKFKFVIEKQIKNK